MPDAEPEEQAEPHGQPSWVEWVSQGSFFFFFLVIAWLPLNISWRISDMGVPAPDLQQEVSIFFFDLPAIGLALVTLISLRWAGTRVRLGFPVIATALLVLLVALSWVLDPSARGIQTTLRVTEAVLLAIVARNLIPGYNAVTAAAGFVVGSCVQASIGIMQVLRGETLGLTRIGEHPPLTVFGDSISAKGSFVHHYIFGAFMLVAATLAIVLVVRTGRKLWLAPLPLLGAAFGYTYSRAGAVSVILATIVLVIHAIRGKRLLAVAAAMLLLGCGITIISSPDGWLQRVRQTVGSGGTGIDLNTISTERVLFMKQAWEMIKEEPLTGIGAGRYSFALAEQLGESLDSGIEFKPVHNVIALITAESGIPAGLAAVALLAWLGLAALRAGPEAQALFAIYFPFLMLDHFPYDAPMGLALTGLWAGTIAWLRTHRPDEAVVPEG